MKKNKFLLMTLLALPITFIHSYDDDFASSSDDAAANPQPKSSLRGSATSNRLTVPTYKNNPTDADMPAILDQMATSMKSIKDQQAREDFFADIIFKNGKGLADALIKGNTWNTRVTEMVYDSPTQHTGEISRFCSAANAQKDYLNGSSGQERARAIKSFWNIKIGRFFRKLAGNLTKADYLDFARGAETPQDLQKWLAEKGKDETSKKTYTNRDGTLNLDADRKAILNTMVQDAIKGDQNLLKLFQDKSLKLPLTENQKTAMEDARATLSAPRQRGGWTKGSGSKPTDDKVNEDKGGDRAGEAPNRGGWAKNRAGRG